MLKIKYLLLIYMSANINNFFLNQRVNYLENQISNILPIPSGGFSLENVLIKGNSAGSTNIDLNNQDILNGETINTDIITSDNYKITTNKQIWNSTDGYYALSKKVNPSLNPNSFGVKSVDTWTTRLSAADNQWFSICFSPELFLFVAVAISGSGNRAMVSKDGFNWVTSSPPDFAWSDVIWCSELSIFVAVARSGTNSQRAMYSSDGISWTLCVTPNDSYQWQSVCWSPELSLFVAVAQSGGTSTSSRVMTSSDGINWTLQSFGIVRQWSSVCWAKELGLFVATAFSGTGNRVITSPDGITWTPQVSASDNNWRSVCWAKEVGLLVCVSATGSGDLVMTSPDGITWTSQVTPVDNQWQHVVWSNTLNVFVAVSATGTGDRIMSSPNAIDWTIRASPVDNTWRQTCYCEELGIFASVSSTGLNDRVMTSNLGGRPPTSFNVFDSSFNNIDSNGEWSLNVKNITSGGTLILDSPILDFKNINTTTATSSQNAEVRATSAGLKTTSYLQCKLNGVDIWIPQFLTDPSS